VSIEEVKQWIIANRKGLIVGAAAALLIRGLLK
jgi:hypothetical protein